MSFSALSQSSQIENFNSLTYTGGTSHREARRVQLTTKKDQIDTSNDENGTVLISKEARGPSDELFCEFHFVSKDLHNFKSDLHTAISKLGGGLRKDLKDEMTMLKHELNHKLTEMGTTLQAQGRAVAEAEERISKVETSGSVTKETLLYLLKEQRKLRQKVTNLESRSIRNNIRIFGVPEDVEGDGQGISFPTPFARIRIHWSTGPRTYEDAQASVLELKARGIPVTTAREEPGSSRRSVYWKRSHGNRQMQEAQRDEWRRE